MDVFIYSTLDGKAVVHGHGTFSDRFFNPRAGHIMKMIVSATCEVVLERLPGKMERSFSEEIGINLLQ